MEVISDNYGTLSGQKRKIYPDKKGDCGKLPDKKGSFPGKQKPSWPNNKTGRKNTRVYSILYSLQAQEHLLSKSQND